MSSSMLSEEVFILVLTTFIITKKPSDLILNNTTQLCLKLFKDCFHQQFEIVYENFDIITTAFI